MNKSSFFIQKKIAPSYNVLGDNMKRFLEYAGLSAIMLFSFYYTEKAAILVQNKNPIMQKIQEEAKNLNIASVSAEINGDYIVPGINGLSVNKEKSFQKMKNFGDFNTYFMVYEQVKPKVSLDENKQKVIQRGNKKKQAVTFVITDANTPIATYLKNNKIPASLLVTSDALQENSYFEQINAETEKPKFHEVEKKLYQTDQNKNICVLNNRNKDFCMSNGNYLVEKTIELTQTNVVEIKNKIEWGAIIFINENAKLSDFEVIYQQVKYKNIKVIPLSEMIDEENSR